MPSNANPLGSGVGVEVTGESVANVPTPEVDSSK